jgi:hypothetical protein
MGVSVEGGCFQRGLIEGEKKRKEKRQATEYLEKYL